MKKSDRKCFFINGLWVEIILSFNSFGFGGNQQRITFFIKLLANELDSFQIPGWPFATRYCFFIRLESFLGFIMTLASGEKRIEYPILLAKAVHRTSPPDLKPSGNLPTLSKTFLLMNKLQVLATFLFWTLDFICILKRLS